MSLKHLVYFDGAAISRRWRAQVGLRIEGNPAPTLCGKILELPRPAPFFHDDPQACAACLEKAPSIPSPKYPLMDVSP